MYNTNMSVALGHLGMHSLNLGRFRYSPFKNGVKMTSHTYLHSRIFTMIRPISFRLDKEVVMSPGDKLNTTCHFRSMSRFDTTKQGQGTQQEMCYTFVMFYPKQHITQKSTFVWRSCCLATMVNNFPAFRVKEGRMMFLPYKVYFTINIFVI